MGKKECFKMVKRQILFDSYRRLHSYFCYLPQSVIAIWLLGVESSGLELMSPCWPAACTCQNSGFFSNKSINSSEEVAACLPIYPIASLLSPPETPNPKYLKFYIITCLPVTQNYTQPSCDADAMMHMWRIDKIISPAEGVERQLLVLEM